MAKKNEQLFEESSQGAVGAVTAIAFLLSIVLVFGGMILSSYGFGGPNESVDLTIFSVGLAAVILGFVIPFAALSATGK